MLRECVCAVYSLIYRQVLENVIFIAVFQLVAEEMGLVQRGH